MDYSNLASQILQLTEVEFQAKVLPLMLRHVSSPTDEVIASNYEHSSGKNDFKNDWIDLCDTQLLELIRSVLGLPITITTNNGKAAEPHYDSNPAQEKVFLPGLVVYACGATGGNTQAGLKAAVAWKFLLSALNILDDIQDQDKSEALVTRIGAGAALDFGLVLLELGHEMQAEALEEAFINSLNGRSVEFSSITQLQSQYFRLVKQLSRTVAFAARGQLLDVQEKEFLPSLSSAQPNYYLKKAGLKSALIISYLTEMGAALGLARTFDECTSKDSKVSSLSIQQTLNCYRQFGFAFGMILQVITDLGDFLEGLHTSLDRSRDLKFRNLTLPVIYAYKRLSSDIERQKLETLWRQTEPLTLKQSEELLEQSGLHETVNAEILALIRTAASSAVSQTLGAALSQLLQAENELRKLDPMLEKIEHQAMLGMLKTLFKKLRFH